MKEIEISANEYQSEYLESNEQHCSVADHFKSGVEWAKSQSMSEWVSVETPPSNRTYVLTFSKYNGMDICEYKHGCFFIDLERQTTVSMWQPLPPPPQTSK